MGVIYGKLPKGSNVVPFWVCYGFWVRDYYILPKKRTTKEGLGKRCKLGGPTKGSGLWFRVRGLRFRVQGLGFSFRVQGQGCRAYRVSTSDYKGYA